MYEVPLLKRLGGQPSIHRALEVGCGRGVGVELIVKDFGASQVWAIDLDPAMIEQAKSQLTGYGDRVHLFLGDTASLGMSDSAFDAVFDFGIIHHVPNWQVAVAEIARVLRPGGYFFFEELSRSGVERSLYRLLFDHPTENRFSREEFVAELECCGVTIGRHVVERFFGDFFMGVGRKQ